MCSTGCQCGSWRRGKIAWPPAYREATEKYWAQVKLTPDGRRLEGYVAGAPFPRIDTADPLVATKLVWNYNFKSINNDDFDLYDFDADTGAIDDARAMTIERHFLIEHFRRLWYINRLYVDPKPERAPNPEGVAYKETLHPLIEPFDLEGCRVSLLPLHRPRAAGRQLALPPVAPARPPALDGAALRRALRPGHRHRQLLRLQRPAGVDRMEVPRREDDAGRHPRRAFPGEVGRPSRRLGIRRRVEKSDVYVVEGISRLPQYAYSKRVLYISKDIFAIPYSDMYDKSGELWKIWINDVNFAHKPFASATTAVYDYEVPFAPAITMIDMQLLHATRASLPSHRFPARKAGTTTSATRRARTRSSSPSPS